MALARDINKDDDDFKVSLSECNEAIADWYSTSSEHIERGRNYLTFLYVDQWDLNIKQARLAVSKPCMQFNKLTTILRSILGEQRTNSPALTVRGVGKHVTQQDIDIRDGLLRQIQYDSDADIAFQVARKHAMEVGWGAGRVIKEYEPNSVKQRLRILPIMDFQAAFFDAMAQLPDKTDGNFSGVYTAVERKKFSKLYPKIENPESVAPDGTYFISQWSQIDYIVMAEIYVKKWFKRKIVQLSDGKEMSREEADEVLAKQAEAMTAANNDLMYGGFEPLEIAVEVEVDDYKIKHVKFIGNAILEETDWEGKILPIVYCQGDATVIDGETIPLPFIQDAIDDQKLINYLGSELAYAVVRARKETIIGTPDNFKGFEDEWRNSDQVQGALRYNHDKNAGAPQFITPPVFNNSMLELYQNTENDLRQVVGFFDEARGDETNATSGKAINARQTASKKPVNVYEDNGNRFMRTMGKIILEMIPYVYDTEREVTIRTQDNQVKTAMINQQRGYRMSEAGEIEPNIVNDMKFGSYDIEVRVDGSYDAQMIASLDMLIRLATINPKIADLIPDLMAENSGLKNTPQLMKRLRTLLPPDILAEEEGRPKPPPPPPNPMLELQNKKIEVESQNVEVNKMKVMQSARDMQSKERIAALNTRAAEVRAEAEIINAHSKKDEAILNHATDLHASKKNEPQVTYKKRRKVS